MLTLSSKKKPVKPEINKTKKKVKIQEAKMEHNSNELSSDVRLPLDLLLILDVEVLEESLTCKYAVEYEHELKFCKDDEDLEETLGDMDGAKYYTVDDIEHDRIQAIIDLLNRGEDDAILGHILDRIVR